MTDSQVGSVPTPLTPPECDLTDFEFMPVMVRRLLKSETWSLANGEERAAAIALWFESWHQVPAASLPSEDRMLKKLADSEKWAKVKAQALRGWVLCSDGRLYHPVVAEKALEAWIEKLLAAISGASGNAKRWGLTISIDAAMAQLQRAIAMLREIAPQSKTFKKKAVVAAAAGIAPGSHPDPKKGSDKTSPPDSGPQSPPDRPPMSPPDSGSDRNRQGQGQREGQGFNSDPIGSGGGAADFVTAAALLHPDGRDLTDDEEKLLWNAALALLMPSYATGTEKAKDAKARAFVGGLGKRLKEAGAGRRVLFDVIRAACVERPINPETWLSAAVAERTGRRQAPNRQEAIEENNLAAAAAFAASHATAEEAT